MEPFDLIRFLARCMQVVGVVVAVFSLGELRSNAALGALFIVAGIAAWFIGGRMYRWAVDSDPTATPVVSTANHRSALTIDVAESDWLGREGTVISVLRPAGYVEIDGRQVEVWSQHGHIPAGARVKVIACKGRRIIVRPSDDGQRA